jgi:hypothetical protein
MASFVPLHGSWCWFKVSETAQIIGLRRLVPITIRKSPQTRGCSDR